MAGNTPSDPVYTGSFRFLVEFQSKMERFQTAFAEVSGLDIQFQTSQRANDTRAWIKLPHSMSYGDITLRRAIEINSQDKFSQWVSTNFNADSDGYVKVFNVIIKLLGENKQPLIGWHCASAFPIKWTLSALNSEKSELAMETVVLTCNRIGRIVV